MQLKIHRHAFWICACICMHLGNMHACLNCACICIYETFVHAYAFSAASTHILVGCGSHGTWSSTRKMTRSWRTSDQKRLPRLCITRSALLRTFSLAPYLSIFLYSAQMVKKCQEILGGANQGWNTSSPYHKFLRSNLASIYPFKFSRGTTAGEGYTFTAWRPRYGDHPPISSCFCYSFVKCACI
jgi:hypothetical protein